MKLAILLVLIAGALAQTVCVDEAVEEDPYYTLRLLQQSGTNYVFRGGNPVVRDVFAYEALLNQMNLTVAHNLPGNVYMLVINLLNPSVPAEASYIDAEIAYWAANPTQGNTVLYTSLGAPYAPYGFSNSSIEEKVENLSSFMDPLDVWISYTHQQLVSWTGDVPLIIYVHCTCGCDRTGEFSVGWYMQYQGDSLVEARTINTDLIQRDMFTQNLDAAEWYCFYLKYQVAGFGNLSCAPGTFTFASCNLVVTQSLSAVWNSNGVLYSQWNVAMTNNGTTFIANSPESLLLYRESPGFPMAYWDFVLYPYVTEPYGFLPSYISGLAPNQTFEWGYNIAGPSPMALYVAIPCLCLEEITFPLPDETPCHLNITQSLVDSWVSGGVQYSQWNGLFVNTSPEYAIYYVDFTLSAIPSEFWNLNQVNGMTAKLHSA